MALGEELFQLGRDEEQFDAREGGVSYAQVPAVFGVARHAIETGDAGLRLWREGRQLVHVDDVTITGETTYTTTSTGISYAHVPVHEAVTVAGQSKSANATLVLIYDKGSWLWLTTQ